MSRTVIRLSVVLLLIACAVPILAQQAALVTSSTNGAAIVPPLVRFNGVLTDLNGKPMAGTVGVTFALYKDEQGGAPLWLETQNVYPDKTGHYTVLLGSTTSTGLPADLFAAGEARWLGVQVQGQSEQPRVLLASAPYALKAADAQTIGGLPASAFVLAAPPVSSAAPATTSGSAVTSNATSATTSDVTTTGGTANTIPMFSTATNIQNSILTQTSTTAINVGGKLNLPATGTATATTGYNSRPQDFVASVYNSSTSAAVPQTFQWQAEALNNDKTTAIGTLNLLYASGTATPAETGLKISSNGVLTFASGQTFPGTGTGDGTITGVTAGTDLAGGGTSGTVTLNVDTTKVVTGVTAGTDLTGGGTGGALTLNLDTTKVPQLKANNAFTGNQTITGNLSVTGTVGIATTAPTQSLDVSSGNAIVRGAANFHATGNTAFLYVGDTSHPIEAIDGSGLALGAWKVPQALFIQDQTGNVGIGTTAPAYALDVNGTVSGYTSANGTSGVAGQDASPDGGYAVSGTSTFGDGVYGEGGANGAGVYGYSEYGEGVYGSSSSSYGLVGESTGTNGYGVFGLGLVGVYGQTGITAGSGVVGEDGSTGGGFGLQGTSTYGYGVYGRSDTSYAGYFYSVGLSSYAVFSEGNFAVASGYTKSGMAVLPDDRAVLLYSVESPENWYEDFGSGKLEGGIAVIQLDPTFAQTVNTEIEYHVFLTPNGDCEGLYVAQKTATAFEVRELHAGKSSVPFDYRIVAKQKGLERLRLEVVSNNHERAEKMRRQLAARPSHTPTLSPTLKEPKPPEQAALRQPPRAEPPMLEAPRLLQQPPVPQRPQVRPPVPPQHAAASSTTK